VGPSEDELLEQSKQKAIKERKKLIKESNKLIKEIVNNFSNFYKDASNEQIRDIFTKAYGNEINCEKRATIEEDTKQRLRSFLENNLNTPICTNSSKKENRCVEDLLTGVNSKTREESLYCSTTLQKILTLELHRITPPPSPSPAATAAATLSTPASTNNSKSDSSKDQAAEKKGKEKEKEKGKKKKKKKDKKANSTMSRSAATLGAAVAPTPPSADTLNAKRLKLAQKKVVDFIQWYNTQSPEVIENLIKQINDSPVFSLTVSKTKDIASYKEDLVDELMRDLREERDLETSQDTEKTNQILLIRLDGLRDKTARNVSNQVMKTNYFSYLQEGGACIPKDPEGTKTRFLEIILENDIRDVEEAWAVLKDLLGDGKDNHATFLAQKAFTAICEQESDETKKEFYEKQEDIIIPRTVEHIKKHNVIELRTAIRACGVISSLLQREQSPTPPASTAKSKAGGAASPAASPADATTTPTTRDESKEPGQGGAEKKVDSILSKLPENERAVASVFKELLSQQGKSGEKAMDNFAKLLTLRTKNNAEELPSPAATPAPDGNTSTRPTATGALRAIESAAAIAPGTLPGALRERSTHTHMTTASAALHEKNCQISYTTENNNAPGLSPEKQGRGQGRGK
jgi:intracellular sulfur oxidation DsrE/DsrF family protein